MEVELGLTLEAARKESNTQEAAVLWDIVEELCAYKSHKLDSKRYYRALTCTEVETNIEDREYDV
jgi:hypothetical protein